jgi:hypothetical protein
MSQICDLLDNDDHGGSRDSVAHSMEVLTTPRGTRAESCRPLRTASSA